MKDARRVPQSPPHAAPFEALGIVVLCFGWFILGSLQAASAWRPEAGTGGGFTNGGFDALVVIELILGTSAIAVLGMRGYPLQSLMPRPSWFGALWGAGLYAAVIVLDAVIQPLLPGGVGAPVIDMLDQTRAAWSSIVPMALVNGAYEEIFLLGYLMRGVRRYGASTAIGVALLVRMLYHTYQGPAGVVAVMLFGLVVSLYYQRKGQLFPVVLAHVIGDIVPFM